MNEHRSRAATKQALLARARRRNPFIHDVSYWRNGGDGYDFVGAVDADSRIRCVAAFSARECRAALKLRGLQATVRRALERRLEELEPEPCTCGAPARRLPVTHVPEAGWWVTCDLCKRCGPWRRTKLGAVRAWNRMQGDGPPRRRARRR